MEWLAQNWFWVVIFFVFIGMHFSGGHGGGCGGGHGEHGGKQPDEKAGGDKQQGHSH